jgi:glutathione S-transferase
MTDSRPEGLTLYNVTGCPYAQRTRTLLQMKGIDLDVVELDLSRPRPSWFLKLNPSGKVPVLVHNGRAIHESSVIFPRQPVFPADPYLRAQARILIAYCNASFAVNVYRVLMEQDTQKRPRVEDAARKDWVWLDEYLCRINPDGDFALGEFGVVDLTFAPFFERYKLNRYFWAFQFPELPRIERWRRAIEGHPLIQATTMPEEDCIKLYADYSLGFANGAVPPGHERSSVNMSLPFDQRPMPPRRV